MENRKVISILYQIVIYYQKKRNSTFKGLFMFDLQALTKNILDLHKRGKSKVVVAAGV